MSNDPFAAAQSHQHQHPTYHDSADFDPYSQSGPQPYPSYDVHPAPYKDEVAPPPATMADKDFDPFQPPPKSTGDLRMWRHDHHGNLWTKGGRGRCIGRFCCCTIMSTFLVLVSILLTLATYLNPPDIQFGGINPIASNAVLTSSTDLIANLGIVISVRNPNYIPITVKSIKLNVTYPINNTPVGGGYESQITFNSNTKTTFTFPMEFRYSPSLDPNGTIIMDMATKCGFLPGAAKQQLTVGYSLTLALQVILVTISPPFSGNTQFDCPFSLANLQPYIGNVSSLNSILGSSSTL